MSLFVFSCTVLFVSISQVIGCEDRLRNDLYCVGWGVKLYSNQTKASQKSLPLKVDTAPWWSIAGCGCVVDSGLGDRATTDTTDDIAVGLTSILDPGQFFLV